MKGLYFKPKPEVSNQYNSLIDYFQVTSIIKVIHWNAHLSIIIMFNDNITEVILKFIQINCIIFTLSWEIRLSKQNESPYFFSSITWGNLSWFCVEVSEYEPIFYYLCILKEICSKRIFRLVFSIFENIWTHWPLSLTNKEVHLTKVYPDPDSFRNYSCYSINEFNFSMKHYWQVSHYVLCGL
jgi:hypothetical protein